MMDQLRGWMTVVTEAAMNRRTIARIIAVAGEHGLRGFGGDCGEAAIAINRVLFDGKGQIVGAFNKALSAHGRHTGHFAVEVKGVFWDADAKPKGFEEIESWGMLDPDDTDHVEFATEHGFTWNDEAASEVEAWAFDNDDEVLKHCQTGKLAAFVQALQTAKAEVLGAGR